MKMCESKKYCGAISSRTYEDVVLKNKMGKMLPKTAAEINNGGLYHQSVRCGKSNCRCASGDLHQGYFYFIRKVNGRQRKTYVPKNEVGQLSALIHRSRTDRRNQRLMSVRAREILLELREQLRAHDFVIKNLAKGVVEND